MATLTRPRETRREAKPSVTFRRTLKGTSLNFLEGHPTQLARSASLDTLAERVPQDIRLVPKSGPRAKVRIGIELPEGTVVKLLAMDERGEVVDTLVDGWLPAGVHNLRNVCLPNGAYKLRLETPSTWYVAGIIIG